MMSIAQAEGTSATSSSRTSLSGLLVRVGRRSRAEHAGTGKVATPQQAQDVHADIRKWLAKSISDTAAKQTVR